MISREKEPEVYIVVCVLCCDEVLENPGFRSKHRKGFRQLLLCKTTVDKCPPWEYNSESLLTKYE